MGACKASVMKVLVLCPLALTCQASEMSAAVAPVRGSEYWCLSFKTLERLRSKASCLRKWGGCGAAGPRAILPVTCCMTHRSSMWQMALLLILLLLLLLLLLSLCRVKCLM